MNVSCPECRSVFRVDPVKVPDAGVRARCSVCGAIIAVERAAPASEPRATASAGAPGAPPGEAVSVPAATERPAVDSVVDSAVADSVVQTDAPVPAATSIDTPPPPPATVPSTERARPFNPYLNNTPELRARRLARALVSDLVAYNPQKREEGLRDGTLRQLFREEIRKSWDEYVEQVGADVAESTPHFQDALNDVLAGGRRVF